MCDGQTGGAAGRPAGAGGAYLNAVVFGAGPRPALAIHCALAHAGMWKTLGGILGDRLTITAVDLPGHGRNPDWDGQGDYHAVATGGCAAHMPPGRVDLIGHSFGGTVALRLALERPDRVRSLILIEPVLFRAAVGDPSYAAMGEGFAPALSAWQRGDAAGSARVFHALWGGGEPWDSLAEVQRAAMARRMATVWAADLYNSDPAALLTPGRLEALDRPVLLIQGARSPAVIGAIHATLADRLPDRQRVVIADAGHMLPITHAAEVAAAVRAHLNR